MVQKIKNNFVLPNFHHFFHNRESGDAAKAKPFLPPNKQYLITRNGESFVKLTAKHYQQNICVDSVPCERRAIELQNGLGEENVAMKENGESTYMGGEEDDVWVATNLQLSGQSYTFLRTTISMILPQINRLVWLFLI